ncbi:protease modulator HflC [Lachnoclostridium phytofermentans]|uniref:Protein HflC n=1 Tax=Lachnoclostridium phytofermentans (strain ATCC 700394 / DSM 18823 / ISDg) TaxID=357809 RepID=A9KL19_LACP7|nr:protease modulator HflC [Lachnoclostridium phytofermentans]ABX44168.1 band 7 protein [Lachnoclostridium phytofermentans ISDg]
MGDVEHIKQRRAPRFVLGFIIIIAVLGLFVLGTSIVVTEQDEYTLVRQFGKVERIITKPGLSFKIPFIEDTAKLPNKTLLYDLAPSDVITKDKKTMVADSYVLWEIENPLLFVKSLNAQIANAESRINTTVYNSIKNVISRMAQTEVISGRHGALSSAIMENMGDVMDQYGIKIISVETKHLDLPSDNKTAVYERMISERNNIAASYTAEGESAAKKIRNQTDNEIVIKISAAKAEAEKTRAAGEAEYMRILAAAYSDESRSDFYSFVRSLDAAKVSLSGSNKTLILNSDSPLAKIFNSID